jgi:biotin synthase
MQITPNVKDIITKAFDGEFITPEEIRMLLDIQPHSVDAGFVMGAADEINRTASQGRAEVHAQIGLNLSPCPRNCSFCAFAAKNKIFTENVELSVDTVIQMGLWAEEQGANALFMMATGDYPFNKFRDISSELRSKLKPDTIMIANVGDFNEVEAERLKAAGYTGIYHAVRMGEGRDTNIAPQKRLKTVEAARAAGLMIGTCVEPVGPEHDKNEIVEKIVIGRDMKPCYSGAMRRIKIPGSSMEKFGMLTEYQMAFLVSVVRLAMGRELMGNCTHEPNLLGANCGANLFWAEVGSNPRDIKAETEEGRGLDVKVCKELFKEADYDILNGPSLIYSERNLQESYSKMEVVQESATRANSGR